MKYLETLAAYALPALLLAFALGFFGLTLDAVLVHLDTLIANLR